MRGSIFALAALLAACAQPPAAAPEQTAEAGCAAQAQAQWAVTDSPPLAIEAAASGPTCAQAVVTFTIRGADGDLLWAELYTAEGNFDLQGATTPQAMQTALGEWIDWGNDSLRSTGKLPEWAEGAEQPGGEFPFFPEPAYADRAAYAQLRTADFDMRCVVQGLESLACFAVTTPGAVELIGVQTFPG